MKKLAGLLILTIVVASCAGYTSPPRETWRTYLNGASMSDMTDAARVAKRPVYLGAGGRLVNDAISMPTASEYGDKITNDNIAAVQYMANLEFALYDALRKPGISVQRAGTDVVVILVRDAIMEMDVAEISADGADTLSTIAKILNKYDATFMEIAGYTDAMRDAHAAAALSGDMAMRTGVFLARNKVKTARMFIVGRGAARPIAAQDDIGRLTNRRIEIRIAPAR
ncbi:MAG: OmpA family protein [Alphaproteobacteria bacterium]|nr:OmpA family protein [Alphaproteobacteria bacterium]